MYSYACRDLGVDCSFVTTAGTKEELKQAVFAHAGVVHEDVMKSMSAEQLAELQKAVDGAIKEA